MEKEMFEIRISTTDKGGILITQPYPADDDSVILIMPDQVDIVVKWLEEAKAEIESNRITIESE